MAQYKSGVRAPKVDLTNVLTEVHEVCPNALAVPDIESEHALMHILFAIEDLHRLKLNLLTPRQFFGLIVKEQSPPDASEFISA